MTLKIELQTADLNRALTNLAASVKDMTPIMRAIGKELEAATERNFDDEGARIGAKWKPSQRALRQGVFTPANSATGRRASYRRGETLRDTGRLASSIQSGQPGHIADVTPHSVFIGTNVEYAGIHQFGGMAGRNRKVEIPARPFFGLNQQDEQDIADKIAEMLDNSMK
jgi:phage virion morphogenesis protein